MIVRRPAPRAARGGRAAGARGDGRRRLHGPRDRPADRDRDSRHGARGDREPHGRQGPEAYALGGAEDVRHVEGASELEQAIGEGKPAVTDDPLLVAQAEAVDAVIEVTGTVELAARRCARRDRGRQARRADERRGRRHPRPDPQDLRRPGRRRAHERRRRPARGADEPLPVRARDGCDAGALRQHQGPPRPLPHADDAGRVRRALGPEPADGDLVRRRDEDLVRAGDRRERDRHACRPPRDAGPGGRGRHADRGSRQGVRRRELVEAASSTMSSARPQAPASSCSARTTTRSSSTT